VATVHTRFPLAIDAFMVNDTYSLSMNISVPGLIWDSDTFSSRSTRNKSPLRHPHLVAARIP